PARPGGGPRAEAAPLQPVPVRAPLRPETPAAASEAPHHLLRAALPWADLRNLFRPTPARRLLPLPALPMRHRSRPGAGGLLDPLRPLPGPQSRRGEHRLGGRGAEIS